MVLYTKTRHPHKSKRLLNRMSLIFYTFALKPLKLVTLINICFYTSNITNTQYVLKPR